ncbi:MAG: tetratricopeptide repeat protein [Bacteroidaceae bacterium]|nr:tetratricopeptide repeat protein [Bacteroidaceae bacterium]
MKTLRLSLIALLATLLAAGCSKQPQLTSDHFTVTPQTLEEGGGKVPVVISGRFPEKFMNRKSTVAVTPVLRYEGGEARGETMTFQGEKVRGNAREISYRLGGSYTQREVFDFEPAMMHSGLYMRVVQQKGKKTTVLPDIYVAPGVLATSTLATRAAATIRPTLSTDNYQYAIAQQQEAQIHYLLAKADVRQSEVQGRSVQDFLQTLRQIKAEDTGYAIDGITISAYASPEGKLDFNRQLAERRGGTSEQFLRSQLDSLGLQTSVTTNYTAEDWEGFQQLVAASDIQDKDVILRVLSMYEDPEERERQVRNISAAYGELADTVLPALRRARMIINYNIIGRSDDEILAQFNTDPTKLNVEELIYGGTLTNDAALQRRIYQAAATQNPSDYRPLNNLATLAYQQGDYAQASNLLTRARALKADAAEVNLNSALVSLAQGRSDEAEDFLTRATAAKGYAQALGNLQISQGKFRQAAQSLTGANTNSTALAQVLAGDYSNAAGTLAAITTPDATTDYLKAIVAARIGKHNDALSALRTALAADPTLKQRAATDLEFVTLFNDATFQSLVR